MPAKRTVLRPRSRRARSTAGRIPVAVRAKGLELDEDLQTYVQRRLAAQLGKHAPSVMRVTVRVKDVNGPKGGIDQLCRIKVVLKKLPSVLFENRAASRRQAIHGAILGAERAVRRKLQRRRMKPLRR
jgi:hypothetical protein